VDLSVFFAGTAGSVPSARRSLPAVLVQRGGDRILFDCGEGTQRQLLRSVGLPEIGDVFLTHFHADHWLGLPGMLKTFDLRERERPLTVHGPPGLKDLFGTMRFVIGRTRYPVDFVELEPHQPVERDGFSVAPVQVDHRGRSYGYVLWEEPRPGRFDAELAARLGVTPGPDFGRLQRGEVVNGVRPEQVMGEARLGRKVVFSGDTRPCESVAVAAHAAELLVHDATFSAEDADRARQTQHSTAVEAATIARDAEVRLLALTHISMRYAGRELRDEARAVFPGTIAPHDFDTVEIPLPEKGEPHLVRWRDREAPRVPLEDPTAASA